MKGTYMELSGSREMVAGLVFTHDGMPGYRRRRRGKGFAFLLPEGAVLGDPAERSRLRSLAIPPAYEQVWICMLPNGHLQATGIDARGRKQYRYHPEWHAGSGDRKFDALVGFAAALPGIRTRVRRELVLPGLSKERIIAGIVGLLDRTGYRIGNARYERENRSFGLASLLSRHLREENGGWLMNFRGKSGKVHRTIVDEPRLGMLIAELHELPGQHLFRYEDAEGNWHDVGTSEVNAWLKDTSGGDFTAKQFRTWKATVSFARALAALPPPEAPAARERAIRDAIRATAARFHHTPATCRKYYIHPALPAAYRSGLLHRVMEAPPPRGKGIPPGLHADERRVIKLIATGTRFRPGRNGLTH